MSKLPAEVKSAIPVARSSRRGALYYAQERSQKRQGRRDLAFVTAEVRSSPVELSGPPGPGFERPAPIGRVPTLPNP